MPTAKPSKRRTTTLETLRMKTSPSNGRRLRSLVAGQLHEADPQVVENAREQSLLVRGQIALCLPLENAEQIDDVASCDEIAPDLATGTFWNLSEAHQRLGAQAQHE